ncbi:hypothetical protein D3C76_1191860 [compost metagenome]
MGVADLRDRPVRLNHHRAPGGPLAGVARRYRQRPRHARQRVADADDGGTCRNAGCLEYRPGHVRAEPAAASPDRSPGGPRAAGAGAGLRRRTVELRRAEPPGQPDRPRADRPRRRPGRAGGPGRAAFAGDGGRPAGHPQGRWCLRAAGPGLSAGSPALHDRGQRPAVAARPGRPRAEPGGERAGAGPGRRLCRLR